MSDKQVGMAVLEVTSEAKKICNEKMEISINNFSEDNYVAHENGSLQSPSAESIFTFQELDKSSELTLDPGLDIVSRIDNPQKVVEPWGTYVTFRIRTRTTRWDQEEKEYVVRRRYNDFKALRDRLVQAHLQVVPPLPSRHTLLAQLDRYSKDFVLQRMALLGIFIKRITTHSILSHSEDVKVFLTAPNSEFALHFKSKSSYLTSISDSLYSLASPGPTTAAAAVHCTQSALDRVREPEFTAINEYMALLHEKLSFFNSVSGRINKEQSEIATEMRNLVPILEGWAQMETFNRDTLKSNSNSSHEEMKNDVKPIPLCEVISKLSSPHQITAQLNHKSCKEFPYAVGNPIQEYMLYVDAVRESLKGRDSLQGQLSGMQERLARRREKANQGGANNQGGALEQEIPKLAREVEECHDRLQCTSEALRSDLSGWQRQKKTDLRLLLSDMGRRQQEYWGAAACAWEGALAGPLLPPLIKTERTTISKVKPDDLASKDSSDWENIDAASDEDMLVNK